MPKVVDNLQNLPPDLLNKIAVSLPIEEIGSFCSLSKSMSDLCQRESFWAERTTNDFSDYPPPQPLPPTLTYREYYRGLWKALHLKDKNNGGLIFNPIPNSRKQRPLLLVYPVPRFELNGKGVINPDIKIDWFSKDIIIVSVKNRRLRTGEYVPSLLTNIPILNEQDLTPNSRLAFREVARISKGRYDEFYLLNAPEYDNLLKAARELKFKSVMASDIDFPIVMDANPDDQDLFFKRMNFVYDKKTSPLLGQQKTAPPRIPNFFPLPESLSPEVESPPVPRDKVKKLFGFLSTD